MEQPIVGCAVAEYLVQVVAVRISDEDLAIAVVGNQSDNLFHAAGIEFVEDVVEQEQWGSGA